MNMSYLQHSVCVIGSDSILSDNIFCHENRLLIKQVESPSLGLVMTHKQNVDVIVICEPLDGNSLLGLAMQFKQSMITRDIPILLLTQDMTWIQRTQAFKYCGIHCMNSLDKVEVITNKIVQLAESFIVANEFELETKRNSSFKRSLKNLRRQFGEKTQVSALLVEIITSSIKENSPTLKKIQISSAEVLLKSILTTYTRQDTDEVEKIDTNTFAVFLPNMDTLSAIEVATRIKDAFIQTANSSSVNLMVNDDVLQFGITSYSTITNHNDLKIIRSAETALKRAKQSDGFFHID